MLIFPPDWFPSEPYLSLPSLTSILRQAGHTVIQKDINLEMYDWYFSEDFLKKVLRKVPQQLDRLRKLAKKRELAEWEMDVQMALCDLTRQRIDELIKKAEQAKRIVRGEENFYDIDKLEWAINVFREVTQVSSLVYAPARICMPPMETDLSYKPFVSTEVMDAIEDIQVNVYRDVFEHLVKPAIQEHQPDVIGISIVLQQQIFSSMTFCALIKQHFPHIHVTIGGNTVTRLRDVLPESPLFKYFDSAVVYEGETAFLQLIEAVGAKRDLSSVPNTIYKDRSGRPYVGAQLFGRHGIAAASGLRRTAARQVFRADEGVAVPGDPRLLLGPLRVLRPWRGLHGRLPHEEDSGHSRRDQASQR